MKKFNEVKSITGTVTFRGVGSINDDEGDQGDLLMAMGILDKRRMYVGGKRKNNVTFHKKSFRYGDDGENAFRYKASNHALRHAMFREDVPYQNNKIFSMPNVFFRVIGSEVELTRGYMSADSQFTQTNGSKTGAFTISDAVADMPWSKHLNLEFHARSGQKQSALVIDEETGEKTDDKDTTVFSRDTPGEYMYKSDFIMLFSDLQFLSFDDVYRRSCGKLTSTTQKIFIDGLKERYGKYGEDPVLKPYYITTSVYGDNAAEYGIALNNKTVDHLAKFVLNRLRNILICRPSAGGILRFVDAELTVNMADGSEEMIKITKNTNLDEFFFDSYQFYSEADVEAINKRDAFFAALEEQRKKNAKEKKSSGNRKESKRKDSDE